MNNGQVTLLSGQLLRKTLKHTYTHTHTHRCMHTHILYMLLSHSCLLTQQTRRILLLMLMAWERDKQVRRIVAPRLQLFSLT